MGMMRYFHAKIFSASFSSLSTHHLIDVLHLLSGATGCSEEAWWASVHRVRSYLNGVVAEIRWEERLSEWNHVPHFLYFVTPYVDSMPIASIGGIFCDVLFNPKYAGCVYKVTVAIDSLGNIVWICGAVWSPNSKGVSNGCGWGLFGGNIV